MIKHGSLLVCDKCGAEKFVDIGIDLHNDIPEGWARLIVHGRESNINDILCPKCLEEVLGDYLKDKIWWE